MSLLAGIQEQWQRRHELPAQELLFQEMGQWLNSPLGSALFSAERAMLRPVLERVFGYHILQLGASQLSLIDDSLIGHKVLFAPAEGIALNNAPVANNEALPLLSESIDAVLVHHALDFTPDSHRLLREAARVIIPGGKILIIGFNPYSSWGVRNLIRWQSCLPWNARFIPYARVSDWLQLLDFRIERISHAVYSLPFNHLRMEASGDRLDAMGQRFFASIGAVYLIVASKQIMPMTPVMPRWPRISRPVIVRPVGETAGIRQSQHLSGS